MKRGQTVAMPFGMIFSIFLIVVFLVAAFIAIAFFLDIGRTSNLGLFYDELQADVNSVWTSQSSEKSFTFDLPSEITQVCFSNLSASITNRGDEYDMLRDFEYFDANVFVLPPREAQGLEHQYLDHLDIPAIIMDENPKCFESDATVTLSKGFYDKFVTIS